MEFVIYGKDNCQYCERAKALLTQKSLDFSYLKIGEDFTREELLELAPDARTFPQIWLSEGDYIKRIGGYAELEKYLERSENEIESNLREGKTLRVTFTKKDGTERVMLCTTNPDIISSLIVEYSGAREIAKNPDVARVFDLEKNEWRSFRYDSVKAYEIEEVE